MTDIRNTHGLTDREIDRIFEEMYTDHADAVYAFLVRTLGNTEEAADLTQDTFVKAHAALHKGPGEYRVRPWLLRIASNTSMDALRRRGLVRWQPLDAIADFFDIHPREKDTPESVVMYAEDIRDAQAVLAKLRPHHRQILLLREQQELSYEEICEAMGKPMPAVKSMLFRAREEFRKVWVQQFGPDHKPLQDARR